MLPPVAAQIVASLDVLMCSCTGLKGLGKDEGPPLRVPPTERPSLQPSLSEVGDVTFPGRSVVGFL